MFAAAELHEELGIETNRRIDVFAAVEALGLALIFRPLRGLSGLFAPREDGKGGVLITSVHPLARQRFTAAHELGHFWLRHGASLDVETGLLARDQLDRLQSDEMAAEAFAAWFLMPPELVDATLESLQILRPNSPRDVYSLSLRLGTSYRATAYQLPNLKLASYQEADTWAKQPPRDVKVALTLGTEMESLRADVWALTQRDNDAELEVRAGDRLVVTLPEIPSSGVMWSAAELPHDTELVADSMHDSLDLATEPGDDHGADAPPGGRYPRTLIVDLHAESDGNVELALTKAPVWAPGAPVDRYALHLHVHQPLLGRPITV